MPPYTIFFDTETGGILESNPTIQLAAIVIDEATWREIDAFERQRPASLKPSVLCESFGICIDGAHDALTDVRMAAALAQAFAAAEKGVYGQTQA